MHTHIKRAHRDINTAIMLCSDHKPGREEREDHGLQHSLLLLSRICIFPTKSCWVGPSDRPLHSVLCLFYSLLGGPKAITIALSTQAVARFRTRLSTQAVAQFRARLPPLRFACCCVVALLPQSLAISTPSFSAAHVHHKSPVPSRSMATATTSEISYLTATEAAEIDDTLMGSMGYSLDQLMVSPLFCLHGFISFCPTCPCVYFYSCMYA